MVKIKICGITDAGDAAEAAGLGADMLGFVFYAKSKRYVAPAAVKKMAAALPPSVEKAGVFVDEDAAEVSRIAEETGLSILQFHGSETPKYCRQFIGRFKVMKAFRVKTAKDLERVASFDTDLYLFDSYNEDLKGGTGRTFDWTILKAARISRPFLLSGGLNAENVAEAIRSVGPYGVDVSSGVEERPGKKDFGLMKTFIKNARSAI